MDSNQITKKAQEYIAWEQNSKFRSEVESLLKKGDFDELKERFYTELSFGTGGIRGVMGGGFNRMNPFMVEKASEGLARYINKKNGGGAVAIAHDSRNNSRLFAETAASVFAAHGLKVFIFEALRPTPELSFAVRHFKASAGIVVTASHNPKKYNGYKVYWSDGAQVVPPDDVGIIDEVGHVKDDIKRLAYEEGLRSGAIELVGEHVDKLFLEMSYRQLIRPELFKQSGDFKVVYTPLHGTGGVLIPRAAKELGMTIDSVEAQSKPDGNFTTLVSPNPEEASALKMALEQAQSSGAQLVVGTDPDADRIGIAVKGNREYVLLNGNQHGVLLVDYVFSSLKDLGRLPSDAVFVNTIVTTALQRVIAKQYGAQVFETLTGFKWIAEKMRQFELAGTPSYIMGTEESYGFLIGREVRDKDAITATLMTIEMALYYHKKGISLLERLDQIYEQFGFYQEIQIAKEFEGSAGLEKIKTLMTYIRNNTPDKLGGQDIKELRDIESGTIKTMSTGKVEKSIDLPSSNVLQFVLSDGTIISARPSGTEPKIKFYASVGTGAGLTLSKAKELVAQKIENIRNDLEAIIKKAVG